MHSKNHHLVLVLNTVIIASYQTCTLTKRVHLYSAIFKYKRAGEAHLFLPYIHTQKKRSRTKGKRQHIFNHLKKKEVSAKVGKLSHTFYQAFKNDIFTFKNLISDYHCMRPMHYLKPLYSPVWHKHLNLFLFIFMMTIHCTRKR